MSAIPSFCWRNLPLNVCKGASSVAAPLPFAESEIRFLTALLRARVRFMVVGLTMRGALVTQDVDLWFEKLGHPAISKALQTIGAAYVPPSILNPPMLAGPG